jgi:hypothetical protein
MDFIRLILRLNSMKILTSCTLFRWQDILARPPLLVTFLNGSHDTLGYRNRAKQELAIERKENQSGLEW